MDDYNVFKRDAPELAAAFLTHVVTEYYEAQLLAAPLTPTAIFNQAHEYTLEAESETIGDLNGWWQAPRKENLTSGSVNSSATTTRIIYSTVEYDVVYKTGVGGRATQAEKATKIGENFLVIADCRRAVELEFYMGTPEARRISPGKIDGLLDTITSFRTALYTENHLIKNASKRKR